MSKIVVAMNAVVLCIGVSIATPAAGSPTSACPAGDPAKTQVLIGGQPVCLSTTDNDLDSIPDRLEDLLLARYRPYYRFSVDGGPESFLPAGAIWYIEHSDLIVDGPEDSHVSVPRTLLAQRPELALRAARRGLGRSDLTVNPRRTDWHINIYNEFRHGQSLAEVQGQKNVGLYGHVTRRGPYYQVEYWQFFAFNTPDKVGDFGDHEGDWCTVQLVVDPTTAGHEIRNVIHFMHGLHQTFHVSLRHQTLLPQRLEHGQVEELRGQNFSTFFTAFDAGAPASSHMNENMLRLFKSDEPSDDFLHPVVYIENGTHEFWPSEFGLFEAMPKHGGDGFRYLTATPPNLGEVDHPRTPLAGVIMRYNGRWGAFSRSFGTFDTSPPPGPALHLEWHWPTGNTLQARIPVDDFEH